MRPRSSLAQRLYRALLCLFPGEFRGDYGEAMTADFDERRQAEGDAAALRREAGPMLISAVREHTGILRRDIVDALRLMRRAPGFTALAILMLALGTGVNVAMFSVIDAVMLRSPFTDRERLAYVSIRADSSTPSPAGAEISNRNRQPTWTTIVPTDRFLIFEEAQGAFAAVGALASGNHLMTAPGEPRRPYFECITAGMFPVFGTRPLYGRVFGPEEDRPGAPPTVVLSETFARTLGEPAQLIGTTITLNQWPVTVIGVMPRGFDGIYTRQRTSGWLPARVTLENGSLEGCSLGDDVAMFVRVRPDLTLDKAMAQTPGVRLTEIDELTYGNRRLLLYAISAAVVCVLLIACINVGGLQLERSLARRRDLALRVALGASRSRLIRHALTENFVFAVVAAAAAIAVTVWLRGPFISLLPWNLPHLDEVTIDSRAMMAALVIACVAALIAGVAPVLRSRRVDPVTDLATSGPTATIHHDWTRRGLVIVEIGLSIVVLIAAGLMIQTFMALRPTEPGFDPHGKLLTLVQQPESSQESPERFFARTLERLRGLRQVQRVEASSYVPMSGTFTPAGLVVDGKRVTAYGSSVTPGYFEAMRIPVRRGRSFTSTDTMASPRVAVVNERLASRLRPDGAVIGLRVHARPPSSPDRRPSQTPQPVEWQIVGVVGDTRTVGRDVEPRPELYVPFSQVPLPAMHVIIQTPRWRDPSAVGDIRRAIAALHPEMVVEPIDATTDYIARNVATQRFGASLLGVFGALAVLLSATGLMTTMAWWVRQRTREIGVRVALGASSAQVIRLVGRQGMSLSLAGIASGCLAATWLMQYLRGWIYGVTPLDISTFGIAAVGMTLIATAAIYIPVRRALRVDPVTVLRTE